MRARINSLVPLDCPTTYLHAILSVPNRDRRDLVSFSLRTGYQASYDMPSRRGFTRYTLASNEFNAIPGCVVWVQAANAHTTIIGNRTNGCGYGQDVLAPFTSHIGVAAVTDCTIGFNYLSDGPQKGIDCGEARIFGNHVTACGDNGIDLNAFNGVPHKSSDSATGSAEDTQAENLNPVGSRAPGVRRDKSKRRSAPSTCGMTGIEAL